MWAWIGSIFAQEGIKALISLINKLIEAELLKRRMKKKAVVQVKEVMREKDARKRAQMGRDLLNS